MRKEHIPDTWAISEYAQKNKKVIYYQTVNLRDPRCLPLNHIYPKLLQFTYSIHKLLDPLNTLSDSDFSLFIDKSLREMETRKMKSLEQCLTGHLFVSKLSKRHQV